MPLSLAAFYLKALCRARRTSDWFLEGIASSELKQIGFDVTEMVQKETAAGGKPAAVDSPSFVLPSRRTCDEYTG
jgi:hypothetical protein